MERVYEKITRRFLPFLCGCFVLAYIDRLNIGFAKLQLAADLRLSDTTYGLGAGIFFIGYLLFEIPGNMLLLRLGARLWISRIMVVWGIVSMATAFVHSVPELYVARFSLGVAEAGFFPGVVFYLTRWFPNARRAHAVSSLITAIALSGIIGAPISGLILQNLHHVGGLSAWQWLFLLEGFPAVIAGAAAFFVLDDDVKQATWLTAEEKKIVTDAIDAEERAKPQISVRDVFRDTRVWLLGFIYFCFCMGLYAVGFWLPQLLKNAGAGDALHIGLFTAIPYGAAMVVMLVIARRSDASGKRRRYISASALAGSVGLAVSALYGDTFVVALSALTVATMGILVIYPLLWTFPARYFTGPAAAMGIAVVNSLGATAGFVSPYLIGVVCDMTHSTVGGVLVVAGFVLVGGAAAARLP